MSLKIYTDPVDPNGEQIALAIAAAKLLGRPPKPLPPDWEIVAPCCGPHLRMVDPARFGAPGAWESWESEGDGDATRNHSFCLCFLGLF